MRISHLTFVFYFTLLKYNWSTQVKCSPTDQQCHECWFYPQSKIRFYYKQYWSLNWRKEGELSSFELDCSPQMLRSKLWQYLNSELSWFRSFIFISVHWVTGIEKQTLHCTERPKLSWSFKSIYHSHFGQQDYLIIWTIPKLR